MSNAKENNLTNFVKGAFSTGAGTSSVIFLGLIGLMIVTRVLTIEEYGAFEVLLVITTSLQAASGIGIDTSVERFLAGSKDEEDKSRILNSAILFRVLSILLIAIIFFFAQGPIFSLFGSSIYADLVIYIPIMIALESARSLFGAAFIGTFKFNQIGITNFISSTVNFVSILVFVLWLKWGLLGLIFAKIISRSVTVLYSIAVVNIKYRFAIDFGLLREMIVFSFPLYVNYFITVTFGRIDRILIGILLGTTQVGLYAIARRIPDSFEELYGAFRQVYFPYAVRFSTLGEKLKLKRFLDDSNRATSFAAIFGALFALAFGNEIIGLVFSQNYLPSVIPFIILMIALVFVIVDSNLGFTLVALGQTDKPPMINAFGSAVVLGSYFLFIPALGIAGAALAVLMGLLVTNPINIYFLRRVDVRAGYTPFLKPMSLFIIFSAIILFVNNFWINVLCILLFVPSGFLLRIITVDDLRELWGAIQPLIRKLFNRLEPEETPAVQPADSP